VLSAEVIPSRLRRAAESLVRKMVPTGTDFALKAKANSCEVIFLAAPNCDVFVGKTTEFPQLWVDLDTGVLAADGTPVLSRSTCKVKHDEPFYVRRRKFKVTQHWQAVQALHLVKNPGSAKLLLRVNHALGRISCEFPNCAVRAIMYISEMDDDGHFTVSATPALAELCGFDSQSFSDIKALVLTGTEPQPSQ
jgi:hypothetical protein